MRTFTQNDPLTDAELDRLGDFLENCKGGNAMNLEGLDGFFAALIAEPETVMPSEYNRELFGGDLSEESEFASREEAQEMLNPLMRHWKSIAGRYSKAMFTFRSCWRTSTAWRTGTTGRTVSCGHEHAARGLG